MTKTLVNAPFTINAKAIAAGLLDLFDENERVVLRFGMLPAEKMNAVERMLREKFLENATGKEGDTFLAIADHKPAVEFSMKKLVSECMREIALELYSIGDLVV